MQDRHSNYLRHQAELCVALSRATIDLALATRLRTLADEFRSKAVEWDGESDDCQPPQVMDRGHASGGRNRN